MLGDEAAGRYWRRCSAAGGAGPCDRAACGAQPSGSQHLAPFRMEDEHTGAWTSCVWHPCGIQLYVHSTTCSLITVKTSTDSGSQKVQHYLVVI
eukprot:2853746-Prymnesium_polylepis.1